MIDKQELRDLPWHARPADDAVSRLEVDPNAGLTSEEARARLDRFGPNRIRSGEEVPWWRVLIRQFLDPLIYVLIIAAGVTVAFEDYADAAVIFAVVLINAAIGFIQELRARKAIRALSEMSAPKATLLRDGEKKELATEEVVPGDVVLLGSGARVPADLRLIEAEDIEVDESALTGESGAVRKRTDAVEDRKAVPGDQFSMAFSGTSVTRGRGAGVVVRTGEASQLGQIAEKTQEVGEIETPIKEKTDRLGKLIGAGIGVLALLVGLIGYLRDEPLESMVATAVAMSVGAVPEALPVVLTVALAVGVQRMAGRNAIIRSLPAVETLGSTTVIGADKTGTLTANQMMVRAIWTGGRHSEVGGSGYGSEGEIEPAESGGDENEEAEENRESGSEHDPLRWTLLTGLLANETDRLPSADEEPTGDPTELALLVSAIKGGLDLEPTREQHRRIDIIPFESERQFMATLNESSSGRHIFMKGAPEAVLDRCRSQLAADGSEEELDRDAATQVAHDLGGEGFRVLAMAFRRTESKSFEGGDPGSDLVLAGFQGMEDPPRSEAIEAIEAARAGGIRVIMLTGDHADTARAIGERFGLIDDSSEVVEGRDLEDMTDEELDRVVSDVNVYARVSPEHKLRLVERLREAGEVVAVTGDGVNDAPALQAAHLGVAMGRAGTDVAREASDMVLTDDDFASIASAVTEGRLVFVNIRKVVYFLLSTGLGEVLAIMAALLMGWPLPFIAVQVLWINLVTNGLQDVALAFEKGEPGLLAEPPRNPEEGVINREVLWRLGTVSILTAAGTLAVFWWMLRQGADIELARSVTMTQMVMFQFYHVFNSRSFRRSIFRIPLAANPFLMVSITAAVLAHIGALHIPFMQSLFRLTPLSLEHWMLVALVGLSIVVLVEAEKWWLRRRDRRSDRRASDA